MISFSAAAITPKEIHKFEKINLRSFLGAPCPPDPDGPPPRAEGRRLLKDRNQTYPPPFSFRGRRARAGHEQRESHLLNEIKPPVLSFRGVWRGQGRDMPTGEAAAYK